MRVESCQQFWDSLFAPNSLLFAPAPAPPICCCKQNISRLVYTWAAIFEFFFFTAHGHTILNFFSHTMREDLESDWFVCRVNKMSEAGGKR